MGIDINTLPKWAQAQIANKMAKEQHRRNQFQMSELAPTPKEEKEQKLKNKKQELVLEDGTTHVFDSKKEAAEYKRLALLQRAGEISNLQIQVQYELIPAKYETYPRYNKDGKRLKDGTRCIEQNCCYIADFVYTDSEGNTVVEDVKGFKKGAAYGLYVIKRKLMLEKYGIQIKEV